MLTLFHIEGIQRRRRLNNHGSKGPILLLHGYTSGAITWFKRSDESLPVIASQLYEEGYDVWLGNSRGSRYSRKHDYLDPDLEDEYYWDFDFNDMAENDVPAMVKKTVKTSLRSQSECMLWISESLLVAF